MADPFEVRMRFTSQLQHLNASTTSALKTANYALRHAEFADDLHSCILEQLERNSMNNRANIMYFLPALCDAAKAQSEPSYVRMLERDILRIIDLVAPDDGTAGGAAANVKVVRRVLHQLLAKGFLSADAVRELEECIAGRESVHLAGQGSPGGGREGGAGGAGAGGGTYGRGSMGMGGMSGAEGGSAAGVMAGVGGAATGVITPGMRSTPQSMSRDVGAHFHHAGIRLDKRQIEQRIEEDRERHKRAREGIWAVTQPSANLAEDAEFRKMWAEVGGADEDDRRKAKEEGQERAKHLEFDEG